MPKASIRVMNSYDYSHFEVVLSTDEDLDLKGINAMRIEAQELVDEAIRQYKAKKEHESRLANLSWEYERLQKEVRHIRTEYAEKDWTPEQKAKVKALEDHEYRQQDFDYDSDTLF